MTKVYALCSGYYSSHGLVAIFSTRAKAQQYIETFPGPEYNDIEEYELDEGMSELDRGLTSFVVFINRNGDVSHCAKNSDPDVSCNSTYFNRNDEAVFRMWATDAQHAVKIANERRIALLASEPPPPIEVA